MNKYYQIMTFHYSGSPMPFEDKKYEIFEEADARLKELKKIYNLLLFVSTFSS